VRARTGHGHDAAGFSFKSGDGLYGTFECRTVDQLLAFGGNGRVYSVPVASLPGARGDGQPITTLIELEAGTEVLHYFAGADRASLLLSSSAGYGFVAHVADMLSRTRGGKAFMNMGEGEHICRPSIVALDFEQKEPQTQDEQAQAAIGAIAATHVACVSTGGRILTFGLGELKRLEKGGRGLTLMALEAGDALAGAAAYVRSVRIAGVGRGGKAREEQLEIRSLNNAGAARGRKGKAGNFGFKRDDVTRVL